MEGGLEIGFNKDFLLTNFENALTTEWQKTGEIAKKVGCCRQTATDSLTLILDRAECKAKKSGTIPEVEMKWVPGGKDGTRAWRLTGFVHNIKSGREVGKVKSFFNELQSNCNHRSKNGICRYKENLGSECSLKACPLIIRRNGE
ncbi:MAG: hypothetical protein PHG42_08220 [Bacteroides sp.]|nr:hypothetical protein [Fermentimonas sp.]MDD4055757.1 hypothetical protein [Bacteroides sp.]MDD4804318.1 hypothetical protein [Candidatus Paceibacterota bacterium]